MCHWIRLFFLSLLIFLLFLFIFFGNIFGSIDVLFSRKLHSNFRFSLTILFLFILYLIAQIIFNLLQWENKRQRQFRVVNILRANQIHLFDDRRHQLSRAVSTDLHTFIWIHICMLFPLSPNTLYTLTQFECEWVFSSFLSEYWRK